MTSEARGNSSKRSRARMGFYAATGVFSNEEALFFVFVVLQE